MEIWNLYDKDRIDTGRTMKRGERIPECFFHLVVHLCIFNSYGQMLIQQRQAFKEGWSNLWDITAGGSALAGEDSRQAIERELYEELSLRIDMSNTRPVLTINFDGGFDDIYSIKRDVNIENLNYQYEEVQAAKWASLEEIYTMIDSKSFIPYKKDFIGMLFHLCDNNGFLTEGDFTIKSERE